MPVLFLLDKNMSVEVVGGLHIDTMLENTALTSSPDDRGTQ